MEILNQHLELVRAALYRRDMKYVGCFMFNKAAERMEEIGLPILPALEHVIRDEVMPICPFDPDAQYKVFPDFKSLVGSYLAIVKKDGQLNHAAAFIKPLTGPVLVEAIRYISIEWDHVIPEPFLNIVETAAQRGSPEEREIAAWALNWHYNKSRTEAEMAAARQASSSWPESTPPLSETRTS